MSAGARCPCAVNRGAVQTGGPTSRCQAKSSLCTHPTARCSASPSPPSLPRIPDTVYTAANHTGEMIRPALLTQGCSNRSSAGQRLETSAEKTLHSANKKQWHSSSHMLCISGLPSSWSQRVTLGGGGGAFYFTEEGLLCNNCCWGSLIEDFTGSQGPSRALGDITCYICHSSIALITWLRMCTFPFFLKKCVKIYKLYCEVILFSRLRFTLFSYDASK